MENKWLCSKCEREFPRKFNRDRHEEKNTCEKQYEGEFECVDCNFRSKSRNVLYNHAATDHGVTAYIPGVNRRRRTRELQQPYLMQQGLITSNGSNVPEPDEPAVAPIESIESLQYIRIDENVVVPPAKVPIDENWVDTPCDCSPSDADPCGANSNCINVLTSSDCSDSCPAKDKCQNKKFTNRIYAKMQLKHFKSKGWGLIAMEYIPKGSFVIEFIGEIIDKPEFDLRFKQSLENEVESLYFMSLEGGLCIDSTVQGNEARFINHSCQPNCITKKWTAKIGLTKIGLFASVDIAPNTELTFNYGWDKNPMPQRMMKCFCEAPNCSGIFGQQK